MVMNDKPYGKNIQTHPQYRQTSAKDFNSEKKHLLDALDKFIQSENEAENIPHTLFGKMTIQEKGWAMYKHIDHHLTQFHA